MKTRMIRSLVVVAALVALVTPTVPVQALPQFGYEINYYRWYPQYQAWGIIGSEWQYCWMYRSQSDGNTTSHDCFDVKEVVDMDCDTDEWTYSYYYYNGLQWVAYYGQEMSCIG